ncbi:NUDIX domain-containing protein [Patescibacteria group bacterium]
MMNYRFCPLCSHKLVRKSFHDEHQFVCSSCGFVFYQNAKPAVAGFITRGNKLLLVRRAVKPKIGWWDVPGGFTKENEHPLQALRRELREELGVNVKVGKLFSIQMDVYHNGNGPKSWVLNIYYIASIIQGTMKPDDDISEARWFPIHKLPKHLGFKHIKKAVRDWKKLKKK